MVMRIQFLGGASKVGSLGMLLDHGQDLLLFDYGFLPSKPPGFPLDAPPVKTCYFTHAHIDHSGMVPWLCSRHNTTAYATPVTVATSELLFRDSIKVTNLEGFAFPYDEEDLMATRDNLRDMRFGETRREGDLEITSHPAGHIPGATMYEVMNREVVLFTGDINTANTELVWGAKPVKCDTLILESTYAGRRHPDRLQLEHDFLKKVRAAIERGGIALVPAFAVGRTQEMMLLLNKKRFDLWVDGMGKEICRIYRAFPESVRNPRNLRRVMKDSRQVRSETGREKALRGEVIVTTSGMMDGGPVIRYMERIANDPRSGVFITGYQVEGTNGRLLRDTGMIDLHGVKVKVKCEVSFFDFSAHADHDDLLDFIDGCDPEKVVLCHGENREELANDIEGREVLMPMEGEWLDI